MTRPAIKLDPDALTNRDKDALLLCGRMPFISTGEMADICGAVSSNMLRNLRILRDMGLVSEMRHVGLYGDTAERWCLTGAGVETGELLRVLPTSMEWHRRILARIDAAAALYRLADIASTLLGRRCEWLWRGRGWISGSFDMGEGRVRRYRAWAARYRGGRRFREWEA